ncbi:hypothetical protein WBG78_21770 [Chryseolinea sp. T2]|uniref:hypothetical protein n=1 Tax=Chryseolinea sp. T2 TaxID=3129255 RepID=UPI003077C24E
MNTITIIAILIISLFFTITFVVILKSRGPWGSAWTFLTINILWLAAVSLWIPPAGPLWIGAPWIDLFITGLLLSFLLSATPGSSPNARADEEDILNENNQKSSVKTIQHNGVSIVTSTEKASKDEAMAIPSHGTATKVRVGGLFWMLLLCLCALIIIGAV